MDFIIRIANTNILVHSVNRGIYNVCRHYLVSEDEEPEIEIRTDDDLIKEEYEQVRKSGVPIHSVRSAERLLVQRLITEALLTRDTLLIHGAVIALGNTAHMFTGKSGTGKTTHIQKWLEHAPGAYVVNGDKPFVIIDKEDVFSCGTPWCGKEDMGTNAIVPLRSIVFMERSSENQIEAVPFRSILPNLLEQTYRPSDADKMKKTLELLMKLKDFVTFYHFKFNNYKEDAFRTSFNALTMQELHREKYV